MNTTSSTFSHISSSASYIPSHVHVYHRIHQVWPAATEGQPVWWGADSECKYLCGCSMMSEWELHIPVEKECVRCPPGSGLNALSLSLLQTCTWVNARAALLQISLDWQKTFSAFKCNSREVWFCFCLAAGQSLTACLTWLSSLTEGCVLLLLTTVSVIISFIFGNNNLHHYYLEILGFISSCSESPLDFSHFMPF